MERAVREAFRDWNENGDFSGVFSVTGPESSIFREACGFRNRAEQLPNRLDTAFAIASGTKLFTALAVCGLIDRGRLALEDRVWDLLPYDLGRIDRDVTVRHLLTHMSGIGDYIDEEASGDYNDILALYDHHPVHRWETLAYYLPLFADLPPKFRPGERVGYSNAGFILLGLVVEAIAGMAYQRYVKENIIAPFGLARTGFYRMNRLPGNVALGYVDAETTNILYMPIVGGADGGLFTCAEDMDKLWRAVMADRLFSGAMRERFLTPHGGFGLGVYLQDGVYYTLGGDFGVDFFSAYFPRTGIVASALGNTEKNTYSLFERLRGILV